MAEPGNPETIYVLEMTMKFARVRLLLLISRLLAVPIEVHQTFFVKGIKSKMSLS